MGATKLSTKGQIVLPADLRARLGWAPGTVLEVVERDGVVELRRAVEIPVAIWDEAIGLLPYEGPVLSPEEMDAAVAAAARDWER